VSLELKGDHASAFAGVGGDADDGVHGDVGVLQRVLGLGVHSSETDFAVLEVPDGATVEVFGPASVYNRHLTRPVAGFLVSNLDDAVAELRAAGVEIVLPVQGGETRSWVHFRAPDGFIYELVEDRST
jgi:catechol 2,3-dioxygenase-like lactoylglutathione lyase family enzyme